MTTFIIITVVVILIIVILNNIKAPTKKTPKSLMDKLNEDPKFNELQELFKAMQELNAEGTEDDVMPEGIGEFGLEITNPIPVNTAFGSTAYLGRLRTMDGVKVGYDRIGSMKAPNITSVIDGYRITANEKEIAILYICPYNKKNSDRAPKGFKLAALPFA